MITKVAFEKACQVAWYLLIRSYLSMQCFPISNVVQIVSSCNEKGVISNLQIWGIPIWTFTDLYNFTFFGKLKPK